MSAPLSAQALPPRLAAALWRGSDLGAAQGPVVSSGWNALDRELPGGGWPCGMLIETLCRQSGTLEWRLLGNALRQVAEHGASVALIGPPHPPFLPGLLQAGVPARQLLWVRADTPAERLWAAEQLLRADGDGALVVWLPQARPEQLRRLHGHAQGRRLLLFGVRPEAAAGDASPAPLRVGVRLGADWTLQAQVLKRRGPAHEVPLELPSIPGGLRAALPPRLLRPAVPQPAPARTLPLRGAHVVGRTVSAAASRVAVS